MPTLKEIKARIGSVQSTLKITSAMKLVSSAKLRKAQNAIEAMRPYEQALQRILAAIQPVASGNAGVFPDRMGRAAEERVSVPRVIIAIASNSSLCGAFNANVIAKVCSVRKAGDTVYSIGRKMADAMRRDGFPSPADYAALADHPAYAPAAQLVEQLSGELAAGRIGRVLLVYNHFVSAARQVPVVETLLEAVSPCEGQEAEPVQPAAPERNDEDPDIILEPGRQPLLDALEPKLLKLKLFTALLDSAAAEHAARTVAMQTASDNAENLLSELTLQYNKGRQQKITSEILDLAGGQIEA